MVSYLYYLPSGIPGNISRDGYTVEQQAIDTANPPLAFGVAVAIDTSALAIRPIGSGDTAANVYGINVRAYPTTGGGTGNDPLGTSTPPTSGITNVLRRGYISVQLNGTTASYKNAPVYIRIANASSGKPIGGFEAAADGANTIVCPFGAYYTGPADTNSIAEIAFNI